MSNQSAFSKGFTLIELMVVIAVLAVLLSIATPSFTAFQRNSELTSLANKLVGSINAARGEAMKTGRSAFVVPANGTTWSSGWNVYVDMNADNAYTEGVDTLVQTQPAVASFISVSANGNAASSSPYISFDSAGYARTVVVSGIATGPANLALTIQRNDVAVASSGEQTRLVIVARTGRIRACKPSSDSSCIATAGG